MLLESSNLKGKHPYAMPPEVIASSGIRIVLPDTPCDGGAHGDFTGDLDTLPEPLLYREPISMSSYYPLIFSCKSYGFQGTVMQQLLRRNMRGGAVECDCKKR